MFACTHLAGVTGYRGQLGLPRIPKNAVRWACRSVQMSGHGMTFRSAVMARRSILAAAVLAPLVSLPVRAHAPAFKARRTLLGTVVDITVADARQPGVAAQVDAAFAHMQRLEGLMSRFDAGSQLSQINRAAGASAVAVAPELMQVLVQAQALSRRTQGAFEPVLGAFTVQADPGARPLDASARQRLLPHARSSALRLDVAAGRAQLTDALARLDLGGVAKLPILQAGLRQLQQAGLQGCMVNGGGDVLVSARTDGLPWRIGVRDACHPDRLLAVVPLRAGVVASSGDYERFNVVQGQRLHHIMDPATGRPTQGVRGVTLVADAVEQVNGLGTAAMVAGPVQAMRRLQAWGATQALVMLADGQVQASAAMRAVWQPAPGHQGIRGVA